MRYDLSLNSYGQRKQKQNRQKGPFPRTCFSSHDNGRASRRKSTEFLYTFRTSAISSKMRMVVNGSQGIHRYIDT